MVKSFENPESALGYLLHEFYANHGETKTVEFEAWTEIAEALGLQFEATRVYENRLKIAVWKKATP